MAQSSSIRALLTRLLRLTSGESVELVALRDSLKMTSAALDASMAQLEEEGLIKVSGGRIELDIDQRLGLALKVVKAGADFETVSRSLGWLEFEELSAKVFEENGFRVLRRFRFIAEGRRWELDLLAARAPYLVCSECKHWGRSIGNKTARGFIEGHLEKVEVFSRHVEELRERAGLDRWTRATIVPIALTLSATPMEIYRRVPSVSVLALPSFLGEFDGQLERLAHFKVELTQPMPKPEQTALKGVGANGSKRARRRSGPSRPSSSARAGLR